MGKSTWLRIANKSNVWKAKIFHVYRHGLKNGSKISFLTKSSVKKLVPLRRIDIKRKKKIFTLIVRSKEWTSRLDGSSRKFFRNDAIILKKNANIFDTRTKGSVIIEFARKKYLNFFDNWQLLIFFNLIDWLVFFYSCLFLFIIFYHCFYFFKHYEAKFNSFLLVYPTNLNYDNFYNILVYGYFFGFFICMRPPFLWFHHFNHAVGFFLFLLIFLRRINLFKPLLNINYLEIWNFSFFENKFLKNSNLYSFFRISQWSLLDHNDILITRILIFIIVFLFILN